MQFEHEVMSVPFQTGSWNFGTLIHRDSCCTFLGTQVSQTFRVL